VSTNVENLTVIFKGIEEEGTPIIDLRENVGPAVGWETGVFFFEDAMGNRSGLPEELLQEDVLRCGIHLFRTEFGKFSADEEWVIPLRVPQPGKFEVLTEKRTMEGLEISVFSIGGTGEITYEGYRPIEGIGSVDSNAQPYREVIPPRVPRLEKPPVFIRGTGEDWAAALRQRNARNKSDRFSVVGTHPHVTIMAKRADVTHRIFVGSEVFSGTMLAEPTYEKSENNWGNLFIVPVAAAPGTTNLRIVVQRARTASFVFEVPASARAWKRERDLRRLSLD
jgi:hypothetical protein